MNHDITNHINIYFSSADTNTSIYKAQLDYNGQCISTGLLRKINENIPNALQSLKRRYDQHINMMHKLAAQGIPIPPINEEPIIKMGQEVAEILPETVVSKLRTILRSKLLLNHPLQITIEFHPSTVSLLSVPWEIFALPPDVDQPIQSKADTFVFLSGKVTVVRKIRQVGRATSTQLPRPLAVQAFCASPHQVEPITVSTTLTTGHLQVPSDLPLEWYCGPDTLGMIQERLCDGKTQIVHLLCHGEISDNGRYLHPHLILSDKQGNAHRISAAGLARVLSLAPNLQLVLLQVCHSGSAIVSRTTTHRSVASGMALELLQAGVPAVIAMQGEISQSAANSFVRSCYQVLNQGGSIERAVSVGRVAMYAHDGIVDWSLPVLYYGAV